MMEEVRQEIVQRADAEPTDDELSAVQVIRRHVRWLEQTIEELQNRHAEYERERRRMEQAHRAECQQLLAIISSLTNATQTPASSPRRARRKATETG
jgi:rubrerythrin